MQHAVTMSETTITCWEATGDLERFLYNHQQNTDRYWELMRRQSLMAKKIQRQLNKAHAEGRQPSDYLLNLVGNYDTCIWKKLVTHVTDGEDSQ